MNENESVDEESRVGSPARIEAKVIERVREEKKLPSNLGRTINIYFFFLLLLLPFSHSHSLCACRFLVGLATYVAHRFHFVDLTEMEASVFILMSIFWSAVTRTVWFITVCVNIYICLLYLSIAIATAPNSRSRRVCCQRNC